MFLVNLSTNLRTIVVYVFFFQLKSLFCVYRSDPTENDSIEGLRPNARGPGLVTFGVREVIH